MRRNLVFLFGLSILFSLTSLSASVQAARSWEPDRQISVKYLFQSISCTRDDEDIDNCDKYIPDGPYTVVVNLTKIYGDSDILQHAGNANFISNVDGIPMEVNLRIVSTLGKKDAGYNSTMFSISFSDKHNIKNTKAVATVRTVEEWTGSTAIFGRSIKRGNFNVFPEFILMPANFTLR